MTLATCKTDDIDLVELNNTQTENALVDGNFKSKYQTLEDDPPVKGTKELSILLSESKKIMLAYV